MRKPRKSTLDAWLDTFADWSPEDQEASLELCAHILRQAKRRARKPEAEEQPQEPIQWPGGRPKEAKA